MAMHNVPRSRAREFIIDQAVDQEYRNLVDLAHQKINDKDYSIKSLKTTTKLLSRNPEYYTIWNFRRRIILHLFELADVFPKKEDEAQIQNEETEPQKVLLEDLQFLVPLLQKYPKCYWIWGYRQWVLCQIQARAGLDVAVKCWNQELDLIGKMLSRDERNFHGWAYRRIVIQALESLAQQNSDLGKGFLQSRPKDELEYTTQMVKRKLSNFSAWHYRSSLIPRVLAEENASDSERQRFFEQELDFIQETLIDPNDQSLWFYHQFLMYSLSPKSPVEGRIILAPSAALRAHYYKQEMSRILEVLEDWGDSKWLYRALLRIANDFCEFASGIEPPFEAGEVYFWLKKVKELDVLRTRRWDDFERSLKI